LWQNFEFRQALAAPRLGVAFRKLVQNGQIIHALFLKGLATDDTAAFVLLRPAKDFHGLKPYGMGCLTKEICVNLRSQPLLTRRATNL
jgi:hypothetical protein